MPVLLKNGDKYPMNQDIDYALVETTRPPIYTAMKYWGKKPHNIWAEYITHYTPDNGIFLDPFCGSAMSVIESLKAGKKTIGFDLNPLSTFMIDVFISHYDKSLFMKKFKEIFDFVDNDGLYKKLYKYGGEVIHHVKTNEDKAYEVGVIIYEDIGGRLKERKSLRSPNEDDNKAIDLAKDIDLEAMDLFFPNKKFHDSDSFNNSFISRIGGDNFKYIWTPRNLYVLSLIFDQIKKITIKPLQIQLLFGFIQTVHLCTKMSVPRESSANRPFSTSWGRSAYLCAKKQMEQNPLYVFKSSCFGKQSVNSALTHAETYIKKDLKFQKVSLSNKKKSSKVFNLKYGIIDINTLDLFLEEKSVDFILTDPPYGGLVQYLDLSYIWLIWLEHIDPIYSPNFTPEITVNKKTGLDLGVYSSRFTGSLKQLHRVLKDDGKMILTFHNKEIPIWNAFLKSIKLAGFKIEKVIHQQNLRSGESVVGNPYGTSGTDFYIRCIKDLVCPKQDTIESRIDNSVLNAAIRVIAERNEPTPYQILFNGVLAYLSMHGQLIEDFDSTIESTLSKNIGDIFVLTDNKNNTAGSLWWFVDPKKYINYPDIPLSERVEQTVISILRSYGSVTLDEVLKEVFIKFPNGLTPDQYSVQKILKKYAKKSNNKWIFQKQLYENKFTQHTEYLYKLSLLATKLGYKVYIGKREQSEVIYNKPLKALADYTDLNHLNLDPIIAKRLEMIDMIWLKEGQIQYLIEVENSTTITSAIQRASNAENSIKRFIVIPDKREKELLKMRDEFFVNGFKSYNWKYITYSDIDSNIEDYESLYNSFKGIE